MNPNPQRNKHRVFIQSAGTGRVECLPGQRLIDCYRSESYELHPAFRIISESAVKTAEAKERIFKMNPHKKYQR